MYLFYYTSMMKKCSQSRAPVIQFNGLLKQNVCDEPSPFVPVVVWTAAQLCLIGLKNLITGSVWKLNWKLTHNIMTILLILCWTVCSTTTSINVFSNSLLTGLKHGLELFFYYFILTPLLPVLLIIPAKCSTRLHHMSCSFADARTLTGAMQIFLALLFKWPCNSHKVMLHWCMSWHCKTVTALCLVLFLAGNILIHLVPDLIFMITQDSRMIIF